MPCRQSHAIFLREALARRARCADEVRSQLSIRLLSVRGYDPVGDIFTADGVQGSALTKFVDRFFADPNVAYLDARNAQPGCFAERIDRRV